MKKYFILLGMFLFVISISCTQKKHNGLPPATGGVSELLVVMPNQKWETQLGAFIQQLFASAQDGLNQAEAMYDLMQITDVEFKGIFEKNRKILKLIVSDTVNTNEVFAYRDVFASPQIIIEVHAKSDQAAFDVMQSRLVSILDMFKEVERLRIADAFAASENIKLRKDMSDQFGFYFIMPESFYNAKESNQFAWYRLEHSKYSQSLMVYVREFVDSAQFSPENIVRYRNKVCMENVPGELPGSYMSTDTVFAPTSRVMNFTDTRAVELRGLWRTVGDFMGGPFLNYTFLDKSGKKVITLEGYVYYPNNDKRDLLMQLEAILHSFTYVK
ncbi:MAG: DUF4837 family protein [Bacteroidales bacterium]|nr:DUF4837 family protein [Bacteroidales bacterium]